MFYQPKVDIRGGAIVGVEALIRWPHPRGGLLEPDRFLPLVRQHGLMRSMTTVVLELALDEAAEWYRRGVGVPVAVNVFAPAVSDPALPGQILGALQARGLSPQALTVEITEVPDNQPLETGESRTANVPVDTMYQTELVEITSDTSARVRVTGPDGTPLCEYVATESESAPRLVVRANGCVVETGAP